MGHMMAAAYNRGCCHFLHSFAIFENGHIADDQAYLYEFNSLKILKFLNNVFVGHQNGQTMSLSVFSFKNSKKTFSPGASFTKHFLMILG